MARKIGIPLKRYADSFFSVLEVDRLGRALSRASAALNTQILVDHVLLGTLGDRLHRTLSSAGTALHAIITDNICHS